MLQNNFKMISLRRILSRPFLCNSRLDLRTLAFMSSKSHYTVLELDHKADQKEIKDAYFRLSKIWHPDLHQKSDQNSSKKAESKFRLISDAYETLSDPQKRKSYDIQMGLGGVESSGNQRFGSATSQWSSGRGPRFGVDPAFGRRVEVDLSEDRMKKAWHDYKLRWEREEKQRRILEEKKLNFRLRLDQKREMFDSLSEAEKSDLRESLRLFRNPFEGEKPIGEQFYNKTKNNPFRAQDSLRKRGTAFGQHAFSTGCSAQSGSESHFSSDEISGNSKSSDSNKRSEQFESPMSRSESNKNAEEFNFKPSMSNDSNKNAEEFEYPMSSDSNKNSEEFEKIRKMRDDPFFEDFFLKKSEKDEDDDDDDPRKEFSGFSKTDFHEEKDPLKMSESPKMNYPEVFHHIKEKSEEIRRNYENSNFLSDYGSGDRPMSEVKVSRTLALCMSVVVVATLLMRATFFNDPCEGNVFLEQLKEQERLKVKTIESSKNCDQVVSTVESS